MNEKTQHQILRFLEKIESKFPNMEEPEVFTDIHIHVSQETGDLLAFDDEERELTRCVVEQWINNNDTPETFFRNAENSLRSALNKKTPQLGIIKPYNYVLENENGEHIAEIFVVDDEDTVILGTPFMQDLDKELDDFINNLLKD